MRNPLARIVGRALRHLRQLPPEVDVPSLAQRLEINENTYRRIEAGTDPMHPAYALRFAEALAHTKVSWSRLSLVLVAVQTLHSEREDPARVRDILNRLSVHGAGLRHVLEGAAELTALEIEIESLASGGGAKYQHQMGGTDAARGRLQSTLDERRTRLGERLAEFLTTPEQPHVNSSDPVQVAALSWMAEAIEGVSPVYTDVVADQLVRLGAFQPLVTPPGLLQWESSNASRFRRVFAVTRNPDLLLRSAADQIVDWSYVWRNSFGGMHILVIEHSNETVESFRRELHRVLLERAGQHRPQGKQAAVVAQLQQKVLVKAAMHSPLSISRQPDAASVQNHRSSEDALENFENAWFFHIRKPNYVLAHVDNAKEGRAAEETTIHVLPWREALLHLNELEKVWRDELDEPPVVVEDA